MIVELCAGLSLTVGSHFCQHSTFGKHTMQLVILERFLFCLNKTAFPIAQTDFFDRKTAFYDHDFTTEAVVLGSQSLHDRRLIGRAVIIITERTGSFR